MPIGLRSQPSCHASLKFPGYSNLLNGDILKMSNLKLSQPGVISINPHGKIKVASKGTTLSYHKHCQCLRTKECCHGGLTKERACFFNQR